MKRYFICVLTGEVIKAWTKLGARKYFQDTYPCKTSCHIKLKDVMTVARYNKIYGY